MNSTTQKGHGQRTWTAVKAWLALVRLPNLPSVPGDPLAGLVLASAWAGKEVSAWTALAVAGAALCLYAAGLILNDLRDLPQDSIRRPERPLPSGRLSPDHAAIGLGVLAVLGLALAACAGREAFLAALALTALIAAYNLLVKDDPKQASIAMGLCRATSMIMGAAAGGVATTVLLPAAGLAGAIMVITGIARREHKTQLIGLPAVVPAVSLALGWFAAWLMRLPSGAWLALAVSLLLAAVSCGSALWIGLRLLGRECPAEECQRSIGRLIGLLLPWQAALVVLGATPGCWLTVVLLLLAWPVSRLLARWFAAS